MRPGSSLLLASALLAAAVAALASRVLVAREAEAPPATATPGPDLRDFTAERKARELALSRLVEEGRWEAAEREARALLDFDPVSDVAGTALERSRREIVARDRLEEALALLGEGREEEALLALRAVPAGTEAGMRARVEAEPIQERVARRARADCLGLSRAGRHEEALARCRLHLDLTCGEEADPAALERLRWLERRLGKAGDAAWSCPRRPGAGAEGGDAETGGAAKGGAEAGGAEVRGILRAWERGEAGDHAALRLERLADRGNAEAARYAELLREAEARLREAAAALLDGELERARHALDQAAAAEERILGRQRSLRFLELSVRFARLALERGLELQEKRRPREARAILRLAAELDPSNVDVLRALWRLEDDPGGRAGPASPR